LILKALSYILNLGWTATLAVTVYGEGGAGITFYISLPIAL